MLTWVWILEETAFHIMCLPMGKDQILLSNLQLGQTGFFSLGTATSLRKKKLKSNKHYSIRKFTFLLEAERLRKCIFIFCKIHLKNVIGYIFNYVFSSLGVSCLFGIRLLDPDWSCPSLRPLSSALSYWLTFIWLWNSSFICVAWMLFWPMSSCFQSSKIVNFSPL